MTRLDERVGLNDAAVEREGREEILSFFASFAAFAFHGGVS